jgi:hypothetical protein
MSGAERRRRQRNFVWLALANLMVALPALTGSWVYDDIVMASSPLMDDLGDLFAVFGRTSADYLGARAADSYAGVTYRPLSMASLIAVQATLGAPLPHHLLSFALHLLVVAALFYALTGVCNPSFAGLMAGAFALHPCAIESYGWINGRSDLLAGLGLAGVAYGLTRETRNARVFVWVFVGTLGAGLSKETGLVACALLIGSFALPVRGLPSRVDMLRSAATLASGAAGAAMSLGIHLWATQARPLGSTSLVSLLGSPTLIFRLLAVALESAIPSPRAMLGLAWQLDQPASVPRTALVCGGAALWLALLIRRRFRSAALLAAALITLLPCLMVRHGLWNGFDRYMYMPLILLSLGVASSGLAERYVVVAERPRRIVALAGACLLGATSFATSTGYASQTAFINSMVGMRPEDPTGYLSGAAQMWNVGDAKGASELLAKIRQQTLPPALALQLASVFRKMGREPEELSIIEQLERRGPSDPYTVHGLAAVHLYHRHLEHAFALAAQLQSHPRPFCASLIDIVRANAAKNSYTEAELPVVRRFLSAPSCLPHDS